MNILLYRWACSLHDMCIYKFGLKTCLYFVLDCQPHVHNGEISLLGYGWVFRFWIVCAILEPWPKLERRRKEAIDRSRKAPRRRGAATTKGTRRHYCKGKGGRWSSHQRKEQQGNLSMRSGTEFHGHHVVDLTGNVRRPPVLSGLKTLALELKTKILVLSALELRLKAPLM